MRKFLNAKIHRATVTQSDLNYQGSITIDPVLLSISGIMQFQYVEIYNITNGNRFSTYVIAGKQSSGEICVNGAGARLVQVGDKIIICSYQLLTSDVYKDCICPTIVFVDDKNKAM